ncbi:unnamed protein product, partial [Meganyctiphanes norvegica]
MVRKNLILLQRIPPLLVTPEKILAVFLFKFSPDFVSKRHTYFTKRAQLCTTQSHAKRQNDGRGGGVEQIFTYYLKSQCYEDPERLGADGIICAIGEGVCGADRTWEGPCVIIVFSKSRLMVDSIVLREICADRQRSDLIQSQSRIYFGLDAEGFWEISIFLEILLDEIASNLANLGRIPVLQCPGWPSFVLLGRALLLGWPQLDLMRNRQRITSAEAQYYGFGTAANSVIIYAYKGDIIYVYLASGHLYENDARYRGYATFTGFKIAY